MCHPWNVARAEHHAALTAVEKAWQWNHVAPLLTKRAASVESHDDRARRARVEEDNAEDGASSPPSPNTDRDAHVRPNRDTHVVTNNLNDSSVVEFDAILSRWPMTVTNYIIF